MQLLLVVLLVLLVAGDVDFSVDVAAATECQHLRRLTHSVWYSYRRTTSSVTINTDFKMMALMVLVIVRVTTTALSMLWLTMAVAFMMTFYVLGLVREPL